MGDCLSKDVADAAKSAGNYIGKNAGEAGESLLNRVETKFGDVMDEVIHERLAQRCDATFDKAVDKLVDKTFEKTFDKAFKLIDDTIDGNEEEQKELALEIYTKAPESKADIRKQSAIIKLKDWGIPQKLINEMDSNGWLDERNWDVLTKDELKNMGFGNGHTASFMFGMNKIKQKKLEATKTLKHWGVTQTLINKMNEEGYLDETRWNELRNINNNNILKDMGFRFKEIELFLDGMKSRDYEEPHVILKKWQISDESITQLTERRQLAEEYWEDLNKQDLEDMQWDEKEIESFFDNRQARLEEKQKVRKPKIKSTNDTDPSEILREWGIPNDLINKLKESGWIHAEYWHDLLTKEDEMEDMGFQTGHISTFKRKFQEWRQKHFSQNKSKVNLSRQIGKKQAKLQSILKRNVDVENSTNELIRVRIIGERKYGSYESSANSDAQHQNKKTKRVNDQSNSAKVQSSKQYNSDATNEQNKTLNVKVGASAVIPQAGMSTAGIDVGVNKTQSNKSTNKTSSSADDSRDIASKSNRERLKQTDQKTEKSQSNESRHEWQKVQVGFTDIMPKQTIVFPVQISDPNAVVYMTIYRPNTKENICENIQIDANFIKIEKVKVEGFGDRIKWQPTIKPPVPKNPDKMENRNPGIVAAEKGVIIAEGLCQFMQNKGIDEWVVNSVRTKLGTVKYMVNKKEDMDALHRHVHNAISVNIQFNGFFVPKNQKSYNSIKVESENEQFVNELDSKFEEDVKNSDTQSYNNNEQLKELIEYYVTTNCNVIRSNPSNEEAKYVELDTAKMCQFISNLNMVADKKINFIQNALGDKYDVSNESARKDLLDKIDKSIVIYDKLSAHNFNRRNKNKLINFNIELLVGDYINVVKAMVEAGKDYSKHVSKYKDHGYEDHDSDEEELDLISTFCDVDGHTILQKWGLQQFYERMADEGWKNPLDWIHINDYVLKQSLGFRPGHVKTFNRKFDLWIRKYNEIRTSYIKERKKGKDGTLLVRSGETKILKSNHNYEFTKIVIRKGGRLTTEAWSPSNRRGGVLFIKSHQELVLEEGAVISLSGKGFWGSEFPTYKGYGPGGGGSAHQKDGKCGAGGAGYGTPGKVGYTPKRILKRHRALSFNIYEDTEDEIEEFQQDVDVDHVDIRVHDPDIYIGAGGKVYGDKMISDLDCDYDIDFDEKGDAIEEAVKTHSHAMGSGGGCYSAEKGDIRGGTGGGAVKIICDKLIMFEKAVIRADGYFDLADANPMTSGGSGGSVWITVNKEIIVHSAKGRFDYLYFLIEAEGGGMKQINEKESKLKKKYFERHKEEIKNNDDNITDNYQYQIGVGGVGRIRIDYHTPWNLTEDGFKPSEYYVGQDGAQTEKKKKREYEIKHNKWVKYGLKVMRDGFVKVDHFDNIYRLKPKFEGAPNLRQAFGFNVYGSGQPTKPAIELLLNNWLNKQGLAKCLWINMRSEPVIYVNNVSLSPRDPKHPCENIDFGDESIITTKDLDRFNRELEKTIKQNIENNNNMFEYHKDTYAPLPADRKDRILKEKCELNENGTKNVYGLESLYKDLKKRFNVELKRITVSDEKAPEQKDIVKITNAVANNSSKNTVIVLNCMMGKGRTTIGMIMACLIKQILKRSQDTSIAGMSMMVNRQLSSDVSHSNNNNNEEKYDDEKYEWPHEIPDNIEEFVSFKKKFNDKNKSQIRDYTQLSTKEMKQGNFKLIKQLVLNVLTNEYKLKGEKIKKEVDEVIDKCQHLQNMRECIYLSLLRYIHESRDNQKDYWKKISKQYLQRYYVLIVFNAYLNDVVINKEKKLTDISYIKWTKEKSLIYSTMGSLEHGALSKFNWN